MGRPSKLTDHQRAEILRRMATGESTRSLAREFGVAESTLRGNLSAQVPKIRNIANKMVSAEKELAKMPVSAQVATRTFADHLRAINDNVAMAVRASSESAAFLAVAAKDRAREAILDEARPDGRRVDPIAQMEADGLQIATNRALSPAMRLIAATMGKTEGDEPEQPTSMDELYDKLIG